MNNHLLLSMICPLSSNIKNFKGPAILESNEDNSLNKPSEAIPFQIRIISQNRVIKQLGDITGKELQQLIENLNKVLKY